MPIKRAISTAAGYSAPTVPTGQLGALVDGNGAYYSAFFQGATQSHPLPLTGGQRIFLGSAGLQESASVGWNVLTGTGVAQTADGLEVTLNAGNPDVIIDLPVYGSTLLWNALTELDLVCASPGDGTYAGLSMDKTSSVYLLGAYVRAASGTWYATNDYDGTPLSSTAGNVAATFWEYVQGTSDSHTNVTTARVRAATAGEMGVLRPASVITSSGGVAADTTDTWDLRLQAHWASGDDLVVRWKSVAMTELPMQMTTVD